MIRQKRFLIFPCFLVFLITGLFAAPAGFPQIKEEREEKTFSSDKIQKKDTEKKLSSSAALFFGFDSNPNFASLKKSDIFQEAVYFLRFILPLRKTFKFTLNYDLDVQNYDKFTDLSSVLNHLRLAFHKKINKFTVGTGFDLAVASYFHNDDGDYYFPKGFVYVRQALTRKLYHQFLIEAGAKEHATRQPLADTISTYQDKNLIDHRQSAEYLIGASVTKKLSFKLRSRFTLNDSNARYLDFYDTKSCQFTPSLAYQLTNRLGLQASYSFLRKAFKERTTIAADKKQKDDIHAATLGVLCKVTDNKFVSFSYAYRNNDSNEETEKYRENVISCGWQYNF